MIITLSGKPGSGKSTIALLLANKLKYKHVYIGEIQRNLAKKKGMTILQYLDYLKDHHEEHERIEEYIKTLVKTKDNLIIETRTAPYSAPNAFKIFLDADITISAQRIFKDTKTNKKRNEQLYHSVEDTKKAIEKRINLEIVDLGNAYGFDLLDMNNYNLTIDTTNKSPQEVLQIILTAINAE